MSEVRAGQFARDLGISASSVGQLVEWRLLPGSKVGSVVTVDTAAAPTRDVLITLVRRAIAAQARRIHAAAGVALKELEAISLDAQQIVDDATEGKRIMIGADVREMVWDRESPIRRALDAMAEPQMLLASMLRVLEGLDPPGVPLE